MLRRLLFYVAVLVLTLLLAVLLVEKVQGQPNPLPNTYVHDFADVIEAEKEAVLQSKAQRMKDEFKVEVAIVTVQSLEGQDQFEYSMKIARSWGIGSPDNDIRGLLILVAPNERKTSIRTSRHLEGELTDGFTGGVQRQYMNPAFKKNDFGGGLNAGLDAILVKMQEAYAPKAAAPPSESGSGVFWAIFVVIVLGGVVLVISYVVWRNDRRREEWEAEHQRQRRLAAARDREMFSPIVAAVLEKNRATGEVTVIEEVATAATHIDEEARARRRQRQIERNAEERRARKRREEDEERRRRDDDDRRSSYSSSYSSSSSSSYDSGSSYSGGSDFGGGGSDSSW